MARALRVQYPGAVYHITSRGNAREAIYYDEKDKILFLNFLAKLIKQYGWFCHAYCLMTNHYHLLIETPLPNLARGMKRLNSLYSLKFNKRHFRVGHVLQGRYRSIVVEKHSYLLELCRYIVLNPIRAKMVERPDEWIWSSYRGTAGIIEPAPFLTVEWILSQFSMRRKTARDKYKEFVRQGYDSSSPWEGLEGDLFLGEPGFAQSVRQKLEEQAQSLAIPKRQRAAGRPSLCELLPDRPDRKKARRNRLIIEAFEQHLYTQSEIGQHLDMHPASISKIIKDWKGKC